MTRDSSIDQSNGLALTTSNNSSLRSYTSSLAESTATRASVGSKIKNAITRKRSKSTISMSSTESHTPQQAESPQLSLMPQLRQKLTRNKSISSLLPPPLHPITTGSNSVTSTRDNSISSLSDCEVDFALSPVSPLCRIEEDTTEKTGKFQGPSAEVLHSVRYTTGTKQRSRSLTVEVSDKVLDDMADHILEKVAAENDTIIEWNI